MFSSLSNGVYDVKNMFKNIKAETLYTLFAEKSLKI